MRVLLVSANRERLPSPVMPIGVLAVAGAVRDAHDVRVLDLCFEEDPKAAIARAVAEHAPDVVGLGLRNLHSNAYDGSEALIAQYQDVAATLRAATPAPLVLGGAAFSLRPTTLLERLGAQYGVVGEGERAFATLLQALSRGERPGPLVRGEAAPLDSLPPVARDLSDPRYAEFDGTANVQTKRGCAFACSYCDYPDLEGRKVRVRDPEAIADDVAALAQVPGITHVFFVDSVFNVPPAHALATCEALERRGNPLPWVCYGSPVAFDEKLVAAMARARCLGVEIGTDAGTDAMLKRLHKPFRLSAVERTRELFAAHGVMDCHTFVLGAEGETADEARATLDFVRRLSPDVAVFIVFMEDREERSIHRARHRAEILELLARDAPKERGWIVPELGIRFGEKLSRLAARCGWRGPSWLELARRR